MKLHNHLKIYVLRERQYKKAVVKQHRIAKSYAKDKNHEHQGTLNGGHWTVRAGHCKSSCVDTLPIQFSKNFKGHSLKISFPVRVDGVSGREQPPVRLLVLQPLESNVSVRSG